MPNWCYSNVTIEASQPSIALLKEKFEEAKKLPVISDFGPEWLGNLLLLIGMPREEVIAGSVRCRGSIIDFDDSSPDYITLSTESAWAPHLMCIEMFCEHFVDDAVITYTAEESGLGLYVTNDQKVVGTYYVDKYIDPNDMSQEEIDAIEDIDSFDISEEELRDYLLGIVNLPDLDTKALIAAAEEKVNSYDSSFLSIHQYEFAEIDA